MRILVAENNHDMNEKISQRLLMENYCVDSCYDGMSAFDYLKLAEYDGAVLDSMLPGMDAIEILKKIRKLGIQTSIIVLSVNDDVSDIVEGLDAGADDYLTKPFEFAELMARVRAMVRKQLGVKENIYRCRELEVNVNEQKVTRDGKEIFFSPKEFSILLYMIRNQNLVLSREQIEANVWNLQNETSSNVLDVYISYLRKKIDAGYDKKMIHTVRGVGYILK